MKDDNKIGGKGGKRRRRKQSSKTICRLRVLRLFGLAASSRTTFSQSMGLLRLKIDIVIAPIPASIRINVISSANSKIRVLAAAPFRVWLECRKIQRKWPPRFARRQTRIIYRKCNKSRQRAVSIEKIDIVPFPLVRKLAS